MSIPDDTSTNAAPPTSPKRAAQDDLATEPESRPPAAKRSRATSPSQQDDDDDGEAKTRATTAAMANASLTAGEGEGEPGDGDGSAAAAAAAAAAAPTAQTTQAQPAAGAAADETPEATTQPPPPSAPKTKMCGVCHEKEGKYKCTRCALPFCSVPCNKTHRENHPPDPEPAPKPASAAIEPPAPSGGAAAASDPRNPFSVLDDSDQLRYLFRRYPTLQARLLEIFAATEPPPELQSTGSSLNDMMKARALAAANPKKEQWTHDVGIRKGKEALRRARAADGEDGEGVREYVELINHLMSQASAAAEAEEVIRKQAAEKDAELIRRLMTEDRG
ncbi:HIT zinc finger [Colletotrichum tamarilloi]|uniref:HIT zinc finger n=1 Tax=Colletotrichum tamarilloi TaxID=1209934 RepID=A0ABQ9RK75_9PEZI|nr:HIT zinc finger [Colletotrichum tamarilloi]KAK1506220.1 HIT zinc finger [Colletotrichum tamarilloi]